MVILEFILAVIAFLFARALWDYVKHRSRAMGQTPLEWLLKTGFYISFLLFTIFAFILVIAYCLEKKP